MTPDPSVIRIYRLPNAVMSEYPSILITVFPDDAESKFGPPLLADGKIEQPFLDATAEMGYTDPMRFAVEHEISHHVVTYEQGTINSIPWCDAHDMLVSLTQEQKDGEEHLVNRLLRYVNLGAADPYGVLENVFGSRLPAIAKTVMLLARPWLME